MEFHIITLFPKMFEGPFGESIIKRAVEKGLVRIHIHNLRDYGLGKHKVVDDAPYGGGRGMVLRPEPIFAAVEAILEGKGEEKGEIPVILLSPQGRLFNWRIAEELSRKKEIILICGHYEGVDERVREALATDEISIGDYILTGGELAAMVIVDAVTRYVPGVLDDEAVRENSFAMGLLEYPQYTRPGNFRGLEVPEILLSGNHAEIARWRRRQALLRTLKRRPDLLNPASLSPEEREFIMKAMKEEESHGCQ